MEASIIHRDPRPPCLFDILENHSLESPEVKQHFESVGISETPKLLGSLIVDQTEAILMPPRRIETRHWQKERFLKYGGWLVGLVEEVTGKRTLNIGFIENARRLGYGPGSYVIKRPEIYQKLARLYIDLELQEAHRAWAFDDWTSGDFIDYIKTLGDELGRKPRMNDFDQRAHGHLDKPTAKLIIYKLGGIRIAQELAGYPNIRAWGEPEFIEFGKNFMLANDGRIPTQKMLTYLSKRELGPSVKPIYDKFGALTKFQELIKQRYLEELENRKVHAQIRGRQIKAALDDGEIAIHLFSGVKSGAEMIRRYAMYQTVSSLLPRTTRSEKIIIAKTNNPDKEFIANIREYNGSVTAERVEGAARSLGFASDIWPMDDYMERLRIPDEMLSKAA